MFALDIMLNIDLTNDALQTALVANNQGNMQIEIDGNSTWIWLYDLQAKIEIVDNKIVRFFNLKNSVEVFTVSKQKGYIQDIADLEAAKVGKCLLVQAAYDKQITNAQTSLVRLGEFLQYVVDGGMR